MKRSVLTPILAVVTLIAVSMVAFGSDTPQTEPRKMTDKTEWLLKHLERLNRLYANAFRVVDEYDSKDESADTLLWSKEKSGQEAVRIIDEMLKDRKALRAKDDLKDLAYQARVRGFRLPIPEDRNGYQSLLDAAWRVGEQFLEVKDYLTREIPRALALGFSPEAYGLVSSLAEDRDDPAESKAFLEKMAPLFEDYPERRRIAMDLLTIDYAQLSKEKAEALKEGRAEEWIRKSDEQDARLEALRKPYEESGFDYNEALGKIDLDRLYAPDLSAKITDLSSGTAEITVQGIARGEWSVEAHDKEVKRLSGVGKRVVKETLEYTLPGVGRHTVVLTKPDNNRRFDTATLTNGKMDVSLYKDERGYYLYAYALTNGQPLEGIKAHIFDAEARPIKAMGRVATDAGGRAYLLPGPKAGQVFRVTVEDPRMFGDRTFYVTVPQKPAAPQDAKERKELLYYPDRSIYRRGQEVKLGLVFRSVKGDEESRPLPREEGEVRLLAMVNGDEVEVDKVKFATDDHGAAQIAFDIPLEPSYTDYHLRRGEEDYQYLLVEDYKLSYLNVQIDSVPTGFTEGRPMLVFGKTTDLNGNGMPAKVELTFDDKGMKRYSVESDPSGHFTFRTDEVSGKWGISVGVKATDALGNVADDRRYLQGYPVSLPLDAGRMARPFEKKSIKLSTKSQPYQSLPLGDLSRYRLTASLEAKDGTIHDLGELPMKGEHTFSAADLPSGFYTLKLESKGYFGEEIRSEASGVYLYDLSDTKFYGDTALFAHKAENGEILLASSKPLYARLTYREPKGNRSVETKSLTPGELYHLSDSRDKRLEEVFAAWEGKTYYSRFFEEEGSDPDATDEAKVEILGLGDTIAFRPGSLFSKELLVTDSLGNAAPAGQPVFVSVYDSALDDAGGELDWPSVVVRRYDPVLFGRAMDVEMAAPRMTAFVAKNSAEAAPMMLQESAATESAAGTSAPGVRRNFAETAYFSALLRTDISGRVKLEFELPDTQTTFRVKMYTFTPDLKSDAEGSEELKVEAPLTIDLSTPRFLRKGDTLLGLLRIQNVTDQSYEAVAYRLFVKDSLVTEGTTGVPQKGTVEIPFEFPVSGGDSLTLRAVLDAGPDSDAIERTIALKSDTEDYTVAVPLTVYGGTEITLELPKSESRTGTPALLELYTSPLHLLLTELSKDYDPEEKAQDLSLFALSTKYSTLAELRKLLRQNPALRKNLAKNARELAALKDEPEERLARQAAPQELARYYAFLSDDALVSQKMASYDAELLKYASPQGGFYFSKEYPSPSVWLTHALLQNLVRAKEFFSPEMKTAAKEGLTFLRQQIGTKERWYRNYIGLELLLHAYGEKPLGNLPAEYQEEYDADVTYLRTNYQSAHTGTLLTYARYAKIFEPKSYPAVIKFIADRTPFVSSDIERLMLELYRTGESGTLRPEVVTFLLKLKQGTMWDDPLYLDAVTLLMAHTAPTTFEIGAQLHFGNDTHTFTPYERATGHILLPIHETPSDGRLRIRWTGLQTPVVIGGIRYEVRQPIAEITPAGRDLTVFKEMYARRVQDGKSDLVRLSDAEHARPGEEVVVRYLIEAKQDLSLVTLYDRRAGGLEQGYDFRGYGVSDRLWWHYARRDDVDLIYIDYLPKGKHVLELEAVANVAGAFSYGPASVQSYFAPEYAGNSAGGHFYTDRR